MRKKDFTTDVVRQRVRRALYEYRREQANALDRIYFTGHAAGAGLTLTSVAALPGFETFDRSVFWLLAIFIAGMALAGLKRAANLMRAYWHEVELRGWRINSGFLSDIDPKDMRKMGGRISSTCSALSALMLHLGLIYGLVLLWSRSAPS